MSGSQKPMHWIVLRIPIVPAVLMPFFAGIIPAVVIAKQLGDERALLSAGVFLVIFILLFCRIYPEIMVDEKGVSERYMIYTYLNRELPVSEITRIRFFKAYRRSHEYAIQFISFSGKKIIIQCSERKKKQVESILKMKTTE